jgi:hypothetical protein
LYQFVIYIYIYIYIYRKGERKQPKKYKITIEGFAAFDFKEKGERGIVGNVFKH